MTDNNSELDVVDAAAVLIDDAWEGSKITPAPWPYIWRNSSASAAYFVTLLEDIKLADSRLKSSVDANTAYAAAWAAATSAYEAHADLVRTAAAADDVYKRAKATLDAAADYWNDYTSPLIVAAGSSATRHDNIVSEKERTLSEFDIDSQPIITAAWAVITADPPAAAAAIAAANKQIELITATRLSPSNAVDTAKVARSTAAAQNVSAINIVYANRDSVIGPLSASVDSALVAKDATIAAMAEPPVTWQSTIVKHIKNQNQSDQEKAKLALIWKPMAGQ